MNIDIKKYLEKTYQGWDDEITKISKIKTGVENSNFLVVAGEVKYIFRIYNKSHSIRGARSLKSIENEIEFMNYSRSINISVPVVYKTIGEDEIGKIQTLNKKRYAILMRYIQGNTMNAYTTASVKSIANLISALFQVSKNIKISDVALKHSIIARAEKEYNILTGKDKKTLKYINSLSDIWQDVQGMKKLVKNNNLSKGRIHGDIKLENILFDKSGNVVALLDFDDYRNTFVLEEVAITLLHNLHSKKENIIRSGNYDVFIDNLKDEELLREIQFLSYFLKLRFVYDICKYHKNKKMSLIKELFKDKNIQKYIINN